MSFFDASSASAIMDFVFTLPKNQSNTEEMMQIMKEESDKRNTTIEFAWVSASDGTDPGNWTSNGVELSYLPWSADSS